MNGSLLRAASLFCLILCWPLGSGVATAQPARPPASADATLDADRAQQLLPFEVTGSRVKRLDYETTAPVSVFTAQDIAVRGYNNVGDFVQSLALNSGSSNSVYQAGSFIRGAATANFRGLGSQRFLTLINGRRAPTYALLTNTNRSVFDFNSLPVAAIESIEILKDGASAVYGADAIGGVVNVRLRRNFSGLQVSVRYSNTLRSSGGDTGTVALGAVAGAANKTTRIMTAVSAKTANSSFGRDYGLTSGDFTYLGSSKGLNQNSTFAWPANLTLTRAQASALGMPFPSARTSSTSTNAATDTYTYVVNGGQPVAAPTLASFRPAPEVPGPAHRVTGEPTVSAAIGNENRYNGVPVFPLNPAYDYLSDYTTLEHQFAPNFAAFAEMLLSRNRTYYAYTPSVIGYGPEGLTLPATNPYNPFGVPLTTLSARAAFGPVSKFDVQSTTVQFIGGLRGAIGNNWEWQTAGTYGRNDIEQIWRNAIRPTIYQAALNGTLAGFTGRYLNPFGPSDTELTNALFSTSTGNHRQENTSWDATLSGTAFDMSTGKLGVAAGAEIRREKLSVRPDPTPYFGSGGTSTLSGSRSIRSVFMEVTAPLLKSDTWGAIETQLAGRYERYSDFGETTKPKVGAKWQLPHSRFANLALRTSYSESFQAPGLGLLNATRTVGYTAAMPDPLRPQDPAVALRVVTGGNPDLGPEIGRVKYAGALIEDVAGVRNLSVSIDYFDFRINGVIVTPTAAFLLTDAGRAQFPQGVVRDNSRENPGPILRLETVPQNNPAAYQMYRGLDYGLKYTLRHPHAGRFWLAADATQITKTGTDSGVGGGFNETTGQYFSPRWKGNGSMTWRRTDWGASVAADWTGRYFNNGYTTTGWGENPYTLLHASVSYYGWWGSTVTVGSNNVLNNRPPLNGREVNGFDPKVYGPGATGRLVYVYVGKKF